MFLAKSKSEETIQSHTDKLLKNYNTITNLYGEKFNNTIRQALRDTCLYHDLGKINEIFQNKMKGIKNPTNKKEIPHGYLSVGFIDYDKFVKKYGLDLTRIIITTVAKHHLRNFDFSKNIDYIKEEINNIKDIAKDFQYKELPNIHKDINDYSINLTYKDGLASIPEKHNQISYIILKGLLNRIDYAASGDYEVEYKNDFLLESLERHKESWKEEDPNADYNDLQKFMLNNQDKNIIAVAETEYGKTEAGLLWIGNNKGFFTLPLRSAINAIFDRIRKDILQEKNLNERLALLYYDALSKLFEIIDTEIKEEDLTLEDLEILKYNERSRQKSLPLTISTIDQIFRFVYKYKGFEEELATLSYSKIVIDEIQMYSPDLLAYLIIGLDMIGRVGGKFSIITATLPPFILDLLRERNIDFIMPDKPYYTENRIRHSMELIEGEIDPDLIQERYKENKVLVIVNTVRKAQEIYDKLIEEISKEEIKVFHGGFIKRDRKEVEKEIIEFGHKDNRESGIWICTQVAEASLDIDFDILVTELSDINGLFQRMGRCYRDREIEERKTNIYVFDGGKEKTSGIGYVNDKEIFNLSRDILREEFKNKRYWRISEKDKINIVNKIYTTDNLYETDYYNDICYSIASVDRTFWNELNKNEVIRRFRSINNTDVIPRKTYEENKELINNNIKILNKSYKDKNDKKKDKLRVEKTKARIAIADLTVSIPSYFSNYNNTDIKRINDYEHLNIYDCKYDEKFGVEHIKDKIKEEYQEDIKRTI